MDAMREVFGDFPGRPSHPDFWRLSEVVLRLDGRTSANDGNQTFEEASKEVIDLDSLLYMAQQRVGGFLEAMGEAVSPKVRAMLETMFITSVITGIHFEKAGGHRDT